MQQCEKIKCSNFISGFSSTLLFLTVQVFRLREQDILNANDQQNLWYFIVNTHSYLMYIMSSGDGLPQQLRSHIVHTHPEKIINGKISTVHIRVFGSITNKNMSSFKMQLLLRVSKFKIFYRSDCHDFYIIKSPRVGDFGVKIDFLKIFWSLFRPISSLRVYSV